VFAGIRFSAVITTAALALACGGFLPGPAHAATALLSCSGRQTVTYKPALTNTIQSTKVTVTEHYGTCLPNAAGITSGDSTFSLTENASCTSLNDPVGAPDTPTYTWNTGQKSRVTFTVTSVVRLVNGNTQVTSAGTVTSGNFGVGSKATRTVTLPALDLTACAGKGVSQQSGLATLTFV
jgi:hypothetical protein